MKIVSLNRIVAWALSYFSPIIPDATYLKLRYCLLMGKKLNLKNPTLFTEKLQWLKLYDRKDIYTIMVDKYACKQYVADKIGGEYIIPTLGVWNSFDEIDFDLLPDSFVLKTTHGGGGYGVVICKDKKNFNKKLARKKIMKDLNTNAFAKSGEWPYKNVPRRIIAEQYMENEDGGACLTDYKFFCFNGEPRYCQVIKDRDTKETIDFFDMEWQHQEFIGLNPIAIHAVILPNKPQNFEKMQQLACALSKGLRFSRIDFYSINGNIYFGEITFFPASGIGVFTPSYWDKKLGEMIIIGNA